MTGQGKGVAAVGKGVLLRQDGRRGIVLTPDGQFRHVRLGRPAAIGEEVTFPDAAPQAGPAAAWWAAAAAAVLLLAALVLRPFVVPLPAVALVAVDINPSIELWVTAGERVRSARALNADGERVLAALDYRGRPAPEVVEAITEAAFRLGFLRPDDGDAVVLITISPAAPSGRAVPGLEDLHDDLYRAADAVIRSHRGVAQVQTLQAGPAERQQAEALGVSPGKYMLYEELRAERPGATLRPEEIRDLRPGDLVRRFGAGSLETVVERIRGRQAEKGLFPGRSPENPPPSPPPGKDKDARAGKDKREHDPGRGRTGAPALPGPRPGDDRDREDEKPGRDERDEDRKNEADDEEDRRRDAGRPPEGDDRPGPEGRGRGAPEPGGDGRDRGRGRDERGEDRPGKDDRRDGREDRRSTGGRLPPWLEERLRLEDRLRSLWPLWPDRDGGGERPSRRDRGEEDTSDSDRDREGEGESREEED